MEGFISDFYKDAKIISPDGDNYQYFYGYYDMCPAKSDGSKHLCHRVKFLDRIPEPEAVADLGYLEDGKFVKFAETTAWNFQQGAMLRYVSPNSDFVYYNVRNDDNSFSTVTHNLVSGEKKYTDRAAAAISWDGKYGIGLNFSRIFDFRPGYGYSGAPDPYFDVKVPEDDGAFLIDMETGKSKLLLSYADLEPVSGLPENSKIMINHVTFNPASNRIVMLVRNFKTGAGDRGWNTTMVVSDLEGNTKTLLKSTFVSHYWWNDDKNIMVFCQIEDHRGILIINCETGETTEIKAPFFELPGNRDIHCSLSPDGNYIIGDGYPHDGYRELWAYSLKTGESKIIFKSRNLKPNCDDIRCDLHACFIAGGKYISFDTTHRDRRDVAIVDTSALNF